MANKQTNNNVAGKPGPGRRKGSVNKIPALLRDAIVQAAEAVGEDKKGKNGVVGYCKFLAKQEPKAFAALMGRVIPVQVEGSGDDGTIIFRVVYEGK